MTFNVSRIPRYKIPLICLLVTLTWALVELCTHPHIQQRLRPELPKTNAEDPTWEQLSSTTDFPYLDAVTHEIMRMHPPVDEGTRIAKEDDVFPLSTPISLSSSTPEKLTTSVVVPKGTLVSVPITCVNRSNVLWGPDAKSFKPERDGSGIPKPAKEISGHRHLPTFSDGPKICLGKGFALTEVKVILSFLIRHYIFEFEGGAGNIPKIALHQSILPRPKVEDQDGARVPLRVKKVE
ncbi:cytochrome P450 [Dendrothele bispora CBS 962.96]|uniref:Cytochrome P450 n=1 Tax=Dendrothele bispora (strain CBS 962.96) TaxID=1314807 RepID=A0A4S8LNL7_DENBC|nr:cytochrome P450 [Dendrothele bispora CBS 962.96]